ncbi:hypothetical protein J5N97_025675 [Dioscorea zingiberensis]|uniref:Uncharacterized protein n=1 Tax=Dioscorea zingiberensis TaxID=325984 RepID=A0A9D5C0R1_9LILI|nr:hypothetical protein J5N97_025675 [Dioscorea zingiberensis]
MLPLPFGRQALPFLQLALPELRPSESIAEDRRIPYGTLICHPINSILVRTSMALSSWLCANNTRNMVVKIVYPGGRVELRDRPIIAAEIMKANPMCCVAHPDVFRQPWSVVSPDTVLMQGQKFYVVPVRTIRKLRHLHQKNTTSLNSPPGLTQLI